MISHKDKIQSKLARQMAEKKCNFLGRTESAAWKPGQEIRVGSVHEAGNDQDGYNDGIYFNLSNKMNNFKILNVLRPLIRSLSATTFILYLSGYRALKI